MKNKEKYGKAQDGNAAKAKLVEVGELKNNESKRTKTGQGNNGVIWEGEKQETVIENWTNFKGVTKGCAKDTCGVGQLGKEEERITNGGIKKWPSWS